jgi:hypothetical protein
MKTITLAALAMLAAAPAMAQSPLFPAPGSFNSSQVGPYTYHNGQGWSGQTTQIGPNSYTNFSTPNGGMHSCITNQVGQYSYTNCN